MQWVMFWSSYIHPVSEHVTLIISSLHSTLTLMIFLVYSFSGFTFCFSTLLAYDEETWWKRKRKCTPGFFFLLLALESRNLKQYLNNKNEGLMLCFTHLTGIHKILWCCVQSHFQIIYVFPWPFLITNNSPIIAVITESLVQITLNTDLTHLLRSSSVIKV